VDWFGKEVENAVGLQWRHDRIRNGLSQTQAGIRTDGYIEHACEARTTPAGPAVEQIHFHPVEPISVRVALTAQF
jgi:hypothetical protein